MNKSIIYMSSLRTLKAKMLQQKLTRVSFPFQYNNKPFSCILIIDIIPYRLYLTTLGMNPITIEFEVHKGFLIDTIIDNQSYRYLIRYLELKYNPDYKFKPQTLLRVLNDQLPSVLIKKADKKTILKISSTVRTVEESEKIYFIGWRNLPHGQKVSYLNNEKTRIAFGDNIAQICFERNVSSCWSDIKSKEIDPDFSFIYKQ